MEVDVPDAKSAVETFVAALDPEKHAVEIAALRKCSRTSDLERVAKEGGGWLSSDPKEPRVKLHRHVSGTFVLLTYEGGWSTRLAMVDVTR